jgi:hypothetical protein
MQHARDHKGSMSLVRSIKETKIDLYNSLNGVKTKRTKRKLYDGIPKILAPFVSSIRQRNVKVIKTLLSFFSFTRLLILQNYADTEGLDTINNSIPTILPQRNPDAFQSFSGHIDKMLQDKGRESIRKKPCFNKFHVSFKSAPSGLPAIFSAVWDIKNIPDTLRNSIEILGGAKLTENLEVIDHHIEPLQNLFKLLLSKKELKKTLYQMIIRKIVRLLHPECKLRVIAMGDYLSQTALKPLNDKVFECLRVIPQDRTFDQGEGLEDIAALYSKGITYYCYDLKSFTDIFPIELVVQWLEFMYGNDYALALKDVMVGYEFRVQRTTLNIAYTRGNPMGFYGSFALTTLMHHFIIYECCLSSGQS